MSTHVLCCYTLRLCSFFFFISFFLFILFHPFPYSFFFFLKNPPPPKISPFPHHAPLPSPPHGPGGGPPLPPREEFPRHDALAHVRSPEGENRLRERRAARLVGRGEPPHAARVQRLAHQELAAVVVDRLGGGAEVRAPGLKPNCPPPPPGPRAHFPRPPGPVSG